MKQLSLIIIMVTASFAFAAPEAEARYAGVELRTSPLIISVGNLAPYRSNRSYARSRVRFGGEECLRNNRRSFQRRRSLRPNRRSTAVYSGHRNSNRSRNRRRF